MGGSQKAPPRLPPKPPVRTRRVYAHASSFEAACPACGAVSECGPTKGRRRTRTGGVGRPRSGYDTLTAVWMCRVCGRSWYVGLLFWPVAARGRPVGGASVRPADHVPSVEEAAELRLLLGHARADTDAVGFRSQVNRVCLCGVACPMHTEERERPEDR